MSQNNKTTTDAVHDNLKTAAEDRTRCSLISSSIAASLGIFFINIAAILVSCRLLHAFLRRLGQHRLVSDFSIGLLIGNSGLLRSTIEEYVIASFANISTLSFSLYLFVLGLEMDPNFIRRWSGPANKIANAGIISTVGVAVVSYALINHTAPQLGMNHNYGIICAIAVGLSSTSSPILTRLITELKMNKSEIGRLAVRAGIANDMLCTFLLCTGVALHPLFIPNNRSAARSLLHAVIIVFEALFITKFINPLLIRKLNHRNPDRKPIRSLDMAAVCIVSALLCYSSKLYGFRTSFNSFFVGLCLPREGRLSNILISRCNFILTTVMLPIYIVFICLSSDYKPFIWPHIESHMVFKLAIVGSIGAVGKLTGTVAYSIHHGVQWPEAVALGLLLNIKGHFHIFCAHKAAMAGIIDTNTMTLMGLVAVGTVIPMPLVVAFLQRRVGARERRSPMGLQWCEAGREVKIVVGLHGPEDVAMAVNVMEAMRVHGGGGGGLVAIIVDMVQMTDKAAASLVHGEGLETVTVTDEGIVEMREQIGSALEAYEQESGDGVTDLTVRRILAVSAFDDMHQDICSVALESMAALVVLPFHCRQRVDGGMDAGQPGHRIINQKVLQGSPCSVGILVNRSFGRGPVSSLSVASINVCAVFIGGGDDREALAYATRMARHPGVRLTVLRFVEDAAAAVKTKPWGPGRRILATMGRQEMEQRVDEEFFAGFYDSYVAGGKGVGYIEKQVGSGADTMVVLRGVEAHYHLFVLGSGKDRQSSLTAGMSDWAEFPELGPIGDVMASSDFSVSASVMVIQQHRVARRYNVIDEEFLPY